MRASPYPPLEIHDLEHEVGKVGTDMFIALALANMRIYLVGGLALALIAILAIAMANYAEDRRTLALLRIRGASPRDLWRFVVATLLSPALLGLLLGTFAAVLAGFGLANYVWKLREIRTVVQLLPTRLVLVAADRRCAGAARRPADRRRVGVQLVCLPPHGPRKRSPGLRRNLRRRSFMTTVPDIVLQAPRRQRRGVEAQQASTGWAPRRFTRCATPTGASGPARRLRSWVRAAAARRRCSTCSAASIVRRAAKISIDKDDLTAMNERALEKHRLLNVGFVFQFFNLIPSITAIENLELPMVMAGVPDAECHQRARTLLGLVGLEAKGQKRPEELSGGEQQRVAIALALANDPALILADEPTGNLDSTNAAAIAKLLRAPGDRLRQDRHYRQPRSEDRRALSDGLLDA